MFFLPSTGFFPCTAKAVGAQIAYSTEYVSVHEHKVVWHVEQLAFPSCMGLPPADERSGVEECLKQKDDGIDRPRVQGYKGNVEWYEGKQGKRRD